MLFRSLLGNKIWNDKLIGMPQDVKDRLLASTAENPVCIALGGAVETFAGNVYINVLGIRFREDDKPSDYVPAGKYDSNELYEYICKVADAIREPYRTILLDDLKEHKELFITSPAAKRYHDNFKGGLVEHTYALLCAYIGVAHLYPLIDKAIMVFLIIKHDFEKINGYTLLPGIEWTYQEELVGHQTMGAIKTYMQLKEKEVDDMTIMAILNALIAHHGKAEWGASKPALTAEARLLQHLDFMISDIAKTVQVVEDSGCVEGSVDKNIFYVKYQ